MINTKQTLPGIEDRLYLTDGGLETVLVFQKGIELPHFASFPLLTTEDGSETLLGYYKDFIKVAKEYKKGFILESPTWRANTDWGYKLGYSENELGKINTIAINQLQKLKLEYEDSITPIIISGTIGPRGDGYSPDICMDIEEAKMYHSRQIKVFKEANANMVTALTMNYIEEATGVVLAAKENAISVVISFTVEMDGKLPSGISLEEAITKIDELTNSYTQYYMINCAHPNHFMSNLNTEHKWINRIKGVRANASEKSHAELDNSTELCDGNIYELADRHVELMELLPNLKIIGGCCGTDHHHIEEICKSLA